MYMPVHNIAKLLKVSDRKIWGMLDRYIDSALKLNNYSEVDTVGMDETSISKGHDLTLFVDLKNHRTIHVAEGKSNSTVESFKSDFELHNGDVKNITEVSMSPAFIQVVKDNLPNAQITFDKFHVLNLINEAVDKVRRAEASSNPVLTILRYIFLKNEMNLTEKQKLKKQEISKLGLDSWSAC